MGWNSQNITNLLIIQAGQGFTGLFIYSPSVGTGNLIGSWAGQAGTDPYGNAYNQNLSTYGSQVITNQPVPVQQITGQATGSALLTLTLPNATTASNVLVLCTSVSSTGTNTTITGVTLGGSADHWAQQATEGGGADTAIVSQWIDTNCAGGQTSVVVTLATGTGQTIMATLQEWNGINNASPLDKTSGNLSDTLTNTTWTSSATAATSQAVEVAIGAAFCFSNSGLTISGPGSPWVNLPQLFQSGAGGGGFLSGYNVLSATGAQTYAGAVDENSSYAALICTYKATAPTVTIHPQMVEQELGGVLTKAFYTMAQSERSPATLHAEIINAGRPGEQIVFFAFGPQNTISPDFAEIDMFGSPNNQPNAATGFLSYRTAAGVYQRMLAWGLVGVSRYSPAGMNGGIALMQADGFARTVTQTTPTPITFAYTIPASDQGGLINVTYRIKTFGGGTQGSTAQNIGFQINAFGFNWAPLTVPSTFAAASAAFSWEADLFITVVTTGSSGTATSGGHVIINGSAFAVHGSRATINTTVQSTIDLLVSWGSATGAPTITAEASQLFREEP